MKTDTCVLLCNLSTTQNWTTVQVEFGQSLLHVLRFAKGFISGPRGARTVPTRMEVPYRVEGVVQARGARRWCRSRRRVAQVHLLRLHHLGSPVVQWQRAADRWRFPVRGRCAGAGESVTVAACHLILASLKKMGILPNSCLSENVPTLLDSISLGWLYLFIIFEPA